jgi:signal transduction histidine kinase/DNA-binding response OmpR family regulator
MDPEPGRRPAAREKEPRARKRAGSLARKYSIFTGFLLFWVALVFFAYDLHPQNGWTKVAALAVLVTLVAGVVSRFTHYLLARPLKMLQQGIKGVQEGRLEPVQVSRTGDEIEYLGESLNSMIRALGESRQEVKQHQDLLEERIRQRTEALEEATQRALGASHAKSEFLANMSHELRTPMNGILGMLDIVLEDDLRPAHREHLETAKNCANALLALLNDILDLSKIESGKMLLERIHFDVRLLAEDCVKSLIPRCRQKGIAIRTQIGSDVPRQIVGDPLRMRQMLANLLGNAVKFTQRGTVEMRVAVEPKPAGAGGTPSLRLEVADTGMGIEADKLSAIFEEFTQADGSVSRKFGGTGLGLAITRRLVELHRGTISVSSAIGQGSVFRVLLPLEAVPEGVCAQLDKERSTAAPARARERVLVVEDNLVNQKVVVGLLRKHGYQVVIANNGREALDRLEESSYDIVLMDIQMPELDGIQAAGLIRSDGRWRDLPIVAMTAHAMQGDRERCLDAGMNSYLSKPVSATHLLDVIHRFTRQEPPATLGVAPASPKLPAPIDHQMATRLMDNDPELMRGMAQLFLQLAPERIQRLQSAAARRDTAALRSQAHKLEQAAERIAALEIARCAREAGEVSIGSDAALIHDRLAALENEIGRLRQHLRAHQAHLEPVLAGGVGQIASAKPLTAG